MTKRAFILTVVMLGIAPGVGAQTSPLKPREASAQMPTNVAASPLSSVQQDVPYSTLGDHSLDAGHLSAQ